MATTKDRQPPGAGREQWLTRISQPGTAWRMKRLDLASTEGYSVLRSAARCGSLSTQGERQRLRYEARRFGRVLLERLVGRESDALRCFRLFARVPDNRWK